MPESQNNNPPARNAPALFPSKPAPPAAPNTAIVRQEGAPLAQPPASQAVAEIDRSGNMVRVGFDTLGGFQALQRVATMFSASSLVPKAYAGSIANCAIAVEMAARLGASPLMVMQNLDIIHGNPSWRSKFLIASFNQCGRFTAIRYRWIGEKGKPQFGCIAWAKEKATGEVVESPAVTWEMVNLEGWLAKPGSKWKTMPELMFCYRAAAFLVRLTAPELTMGLQSAEEAEDISEPIPSLEEKRGLKGMRDVLGIGGTPAMDPPHNPDTGEVVDPSAAGESSDEEKAEIAAREREEAQGR